jgi:RNA polymerase sigma-70 factor (ECF subfamily)
MKGKKEQPTLSGTDERTLVELFLAGDEKAFDEMVTRHQDAVYTLCVRIVGNHEDAGDCAQDVFIKVYRKVKDFRFKSSLATWIYRIAVNTCRNHLASAGRRASDRTLSLDNGPAPGTVSGNYAPDSSFDPEVQFERRELEAIIMDSINALPGIQKELVVLRDMEGKSYEDIALITGLKGGTIKSKLARARQKLRERLEGKI